MILQEENNKTNCTVLLITVRSCSPNKLDYCAIGVFPGGSSVGVTCPKEQLLPTVLGRVPGLVENEFSPKTWQLIHKQQRKSDLESRHLEFPGKPVVSVSF